MLGVEHMFLSVIYFNIFIERQTFALVPLSSNLNRFVKEEKFLKSFRSRKERNAEEIRIQIRSRPEIGAVL